MHEEISEQEKWMRNLGLFANKIPEGKKKWKMKQGRAHKLGMVSGIK